jgi:hypothetical protein
MEDESVSVNEPLRSQVSEDDGILFIDDTRPNFEFKNKKQDAAPP